ncbi:hypothetical protein Q5P01_002435 [Channa striata]|uniref:FIIND domain-containing protein n=1 Tax=Channa striata TaxID=64152 RepID=A0AA88NQH8_CHASR|nr:hypothetical protein Q5P01_002435 [Channa striata]
MASGPALSTARGVNISVGSKIRDSLSLLDVLYANHFEGESFDPEFLEQTEVNFYRGAPPEWLNFHISEQGASDGTGSPFIKRDGYDTLTEEIRQRRKRPGVSTVKLFHQPGCGGTTLAMQVLWDLRKALRCAVLTGSTTETRNVAKEVVQLYKTGYQQNTVLLLLNNEQILENLQDDIMEEIKNQKVVPRMAVVILFSCVRKDVALHSDHVVLKRSLSDTEKPKFNEKQEELSERYTDQCGQFHGFNIMQTNFSQDYVRQACTVFSDVRKANRPPKTQLAAFLALLNAYVPGSYLLESQCLDFLKPKYYEDCTLKDRMKPFSHLIVTYQQDTSSERRVRMAHTMIAQSCTELMAEAGVTRSDTARNFLNDLCKGEVPHWLQGFVKDMLTKREAKKEVNPFNSAETKEQERFSRLILDIQKMESNVHSASVLKLASKKFKQNAFFPQALARFCYIEVKDYTQAERWAEQAKQRDPKNSFIADTLGQVHKNHLNNLKSKDIPVKPRQILRLATKAIEAFKDEEKLAETEHEVTNKEDGSTKVAHVFNTRGKFGYLQVCNIMYNVLVSQNENWRKVLTKNVSMCTVLESLGDSKLYRFNDLIRSLRDEVERKCEFFDKYLTYTKPDIRNDDASYISRDTSECCRKYIGDAPPRNMKKKCDDVIQKLKENMADTSAGVLSCLDRECTESEIKEITTWWKEIYSSKYSLTALVNYFIAHIMLINKKGPFTIAFSNRYLNTFKMEMPLSPKEAPELHMLALLLYWPADSEDKCEFDLSELIRRMYCSYEQAYKKHFGSRYLRPLFFIGKGQGLNRIIHRNLLEGLVLQQNRETKQDWSNNWSNEKIFHDPTVQKHLLKIEGVVHNYRVYATVGGTQIQVDANLRNSLWKPRQVCFYLGFTIRGPVAFGIQTVEKGGHWTKLEPEVTVVNKARTFSLRSGAGHFECRESALRWVCTGNISFRYRFCSWEDQMTKPVCIEYMPAGPLLDITITAGKIEELHLPHWIDCDSVTSDMFAVLHVDSCGDVLEKVSEVTSSHIKLLHPTFSPRGAIIRMKLGLSVKAFYDVLIFKTNKEFLTLHIYLVPLDSHIQETVKENETSMGSKVIPKPSPDKSLQMLDHFYLTADISTNAEIQPTKLKLRHERRNYFEVFIRSADCDFNLKLESTQKKSTQRNTVWTCAIRNGDYKNQTSVDEQGKHFVEVHRLTLINRVIDTGIILDQLLAKEIISTEAYNTVRSFTTTQNQMREILKYVNSAGRRAQDILHKIFKEEKSLKYLTSELEGSG